MEITSISELKASLSLFLKMIKKGEEVLITERGKAFAKIVPLSSTEEISTNLLELEKTGLAKIGMSSFPNNFWSAERPNVKGNKAVQAVLEERDKST